MANDQLTLRLEVDHLDEAVKGMNRAANRLSLSIIVASLIIGDKLVIDKLSKSKFLLDELLDIVKIAA